VNGCSRTDSLSARSCFLERDAEALTQGVVVVTPAQAEDFDLARRGVEQTFEDFERGVLPAPPPLGAEKPKHSPDSTSRSRPRTAVDRRARRVAFRQGRDSGIACIGRGL